jgi:hypothetical protein
MNPIKTHFTQFVLGAISVAATAGLVDPKVAEAISITYEAANIYSASSSIGSTYQVDFEAANLGITNNYSVGFVDNTTNNNYTATYDKLQVKNYGAKGQTAGAGYSGQFATNIGSLLTTNLSFTDTTAPNTSAGIKYFGMFFSSLDSNNQLTFYNGDNVLARFTISNVPKLLNNDSTLKGGPYDQYGAFFNFYAGTGEQFTKIQFTQTGGGGFESDNHTFRIPDALAISGTGINPAGLQFINVPEPSDVVGVLVGGVAALGLKRQLRKKS